MVNYLVQWLAPDAGTVPLSESDPGVVRPERVVMRWRWKCCPEDRDESRVEIRLRAIREGTELTFTDAQLENEGFRRGHEDGWTCSLEKLEARFAGGTAS
jgi:uncharacterized protein YndB with AHSA1/START domain